MNRFLTYLFYASTIYWQCRKLSCNVTTNPSSTDLNPLNNITVTVGNRPFNSHEKTLRHRVIFVRGISKVTVFSRDQTNQPIAPNCTIHKCHSLQIDIWSGIRSLYNSRCRWPVVGVHNCPTNVMRQRFAYIYVDQDVVSVVLKAPVSIDPVRGVPYNTCTY